MPKVTNLLRILEYVKLHLVMNYCTLNSAKGGLSHEFMICVLSPAGSCRN